MNTKKKVPFVLDFFRKTGIFWVFILIVATLTTLSPTFIKFSNLMNIAKQISINGILATGMTFVIISGGIDLSVGAIAAFSGVCAAFFVKGDPNLPVLVPIIVGLVVGMLIGFINGLAISYADFPSFIMTLSTMITIRGLGLVITNGRPIFNLGDNFTNLASGFTLGIPNLVYFLIAILSLGIFILTKTVFGKRVYAIGGNEEAARFSGINTKKIKLQVYMISGLLAGLCGVLLASRITSGNPTVADGYELDAIAAAVIGGVSMSGGSGNLFGTLIGALIIGVINNGLDILAVSPFYQKVIQGLIIATAIYLDTRVKKRN